MSLNSKYDEFYPKKGSEPVPCIKLWVETREFTIREADPADDWDRGDDGEELTDYGVALGVDAPSHRSKCFDEKMLGWLPKAGDRVHMVIEEYGDGCTFGSTSPVFRPVHVFRTEVDAQEWVKSPQAEEWKDTGYFGGHIGYRIEEVKVSS